MSIDISISDGMTGSPPSKAGSLVIVGSGIQFVGHATLATEAAIKQATRVFFAVADPWAARWIRSLNHAAESLPYPTEAPLRREIYADMVRTILDSVRSGERVCAVFYGSPAVLAQPAHAALRAARAEGLRASMLPGVSFLECLFTDASLDPGDDGCHFLVASVLVHEQRMVDARSLVVISQIGLVNKRGVFTEHDAEVTAGLSQLVERLLRFYPADHVVTLYEAARSPVEAPRLERTPLAALVDCRVSALTTLYIPPLATVSRA